MEISHVQSENTNGTEIQYTHFMNKCTLLHTINKVWNMIQKSKVKIVKP
jgi:hypothetical protein